MTNNLIGTVSRISGSQITAKSSNHAILYELVKVGASNLIGEIIRMTGENIVIQAYEETDGLKLGANVYGTGKPLSVELGPGVMGQIFDGIQRPLPVMEKEFGPLIKKGVQVDPIDRNKKWHFSPIVEKGYTVTAGDIIGVVQETTSIQNKIMIPPNIDGVIIEICNEGEYTVDEVIVKVKTSDNLEDICLMQKWPVRIARPFKQKLNIDTPLITGQRIVDSFFPVAKGGTTCVTGGFGTGKTVLLQTIAVWIDADIIVYVGCGERGNEMADVLERFSHLKKPNSDHSLMSRSILIANTSNMPILAREASIYCGITIAEYYRDMGYNVAIMADSTSRWAEALREISGRMEEMPGEEGYPAYLSSRLAEYYSRAGCIKTLGSEERDGSITILSSVSPPGGDFSEPVTRNTLRLAKVFWALDFHLAHRRHYPAINWFMSHCEYMPFLRDWFLSVDGEWFELCEEAKELLREEEELKEIVSLIGADILGDKQRALIDIVKMLKEYFLLQSAYHSVDVYCPVKKTIRILRILLKYYEKTLYAIKSGVSFEKISLLPIRVSLSRLKLVPTSEFEETYSRSSNEIDEEFAVLIEESKGGILK